MAQPAYMGGLLGPGQTPFQPQLPPGLLQMMAQPGQPAAQMAGNMAALPPQGGPAPQPAAPAPAPPAMAPPPQQSVGATGSVATDNALLGGGIAAMRAARPGAGGGSLGAALGEGLASGSLTFKATKDAEADRDAQVARQETYARNVRSLVKEGGLDAGTAEALIQLGPDQGSKMFAEVNLDIMKERAKPETTSVVGRHLVGDRTGKVVYEGEKDPENKPDSNVQSIMALRHPDKEIGDLTDPERAEVERAAGEYRRTGAANLSNTNSPTINAAGSRLGSDLIGSWITRKNTLDEQVFTELDAIQRMGDTIARGGIMTGPFARERALAMAATGDERAQNTLEFLQNVTARVLPIVRMLAPVTEEDVKLLQAAKGGNLNLSATNIQRLLDLDRRAIEAKVGLHNEEVLNSALMRDPELKPLAGDMLKRLPDGRLVVTYRGKVRNAAWDADQQQYFVETEPGKWSPLK